MVSEILVLTIDRHFRYRLIHLFSVAPLTRKPLLNSRLNIFMCLRSQENLRFFLNCSPHDNSH
ncbi:Uncharacterised protein [Yersinia intermedia]|uniref:Uncharacterized protein n=1 Tax=Yersinia intermedia TaxID=631 RepID=A0A0T9LVM8_YERIN|nr:Uncharacterised protein [Yersinia intermedia]